MTQLKNSNNLYVVTGGPAVGKTTLLEELQKRGYQIVPEIARALIKEQQMANGDALPWKNKQLYLELMFERSIESFSHIANKENNQAPIFFDRGFLDAICYAQLIHSELSEEMISYAKNWRYNNSVFLLPPWRDIYETDKERKQSFEEAVLTYEKMTETYTHYGYNLTILPKMPVKNRADFVLRFIEETRF